jgi:hypothetical protein
VGLPASEHNPCLRPLLEAGDDDLDSPPVDHDHDGVPDFRDLDSDGNGVADGTGSETADDLDGDGTGDWAARVWAPAPRTSSRPGPKGPAR